IKNLAVGSLQRLGAEKRPLIVEFNPWFVAGHEKLVELFYREIALAIAKPFPGEHAADAQKRLEKLAAYLSICVNAANPALDALSVFSVPGAAILAKVAKGAAGIAETMKEGAKSEKAVSDASKKY